MRMHREGSEDGRRVGHQGHELAGRTSHWRGVGWGQEKLVQRLLKEVRMDMNTQDWDELTPLIPAASSGHVNVVKLLLREGAMASRPSWRRASWDMSR